MALLRELIQPASLERCGDHSFPVLSMTMHDGIMLQSDRFKKSLASVDQSAYKVVRRNQLVVGFPIDEGVLYIQQVADAGIMSPAYDVWNVDETKVNLQYFELCLHSPQSMMFYRTNLRGTTARRRSLPKETLLSLPVPVPSMERQREIASTIVRLKELIELRQRQLRTLDTLIKALFVEMFGDPISNPMKWEKCKLEDCLERIDNGKSFVCSDKARTNDYPAVLKLSAATYGNYRPYENKALLDEHQFVESAEVHNGDLLFTRKNTPELVGMAAYVHETPPKLMMPDLIFRLVPNEKMNAMFLWQLINCKEYRLVIQSISGGSAKSMSNISKERLGKIQVICPPREKQDKLSPFIQQIDKSKSVVQQALAKDQLLFDSLMQQYFG